MIEISGQEKKIEAFIEQVRPYGIHELARTGRIALVRGDRPLEGEQCNRSGGCQRIRRARTCRARAFRALNVIVFSNGRGPPGRGRHFFYIHNGGPTRLP